MFSSKLYMIQPAAVQTVLVSARGLLRQLVREGRAMERVISQISQLEFDKTAADAFEKEMLSKTVDNAINNVPYYKQFAPEVRDNYDIRSVVSEFPFVTKETVLREHHAFRSEIYRGLVVSGATSGTTGTPLQIPQSIESVIRESAFLTRQLRWAGFRNGDRRAWIRGEMIVPIRRKSPPFWRTSFPDKLLMMSSFHLIPPNLGLYLDKISSFHTDIIHAYPSSIALLARYLQQQGRRYPGKLKSIITSSESLHPVDKSLIEDRFQCPIFDWYGLFERVAAIGTCEKGRYHQLRDYSYVEYSSKNDSGETEIIGTNFNNRLYPLLRYRTGDFVTLSSQECPCGRHYPVIDGISGRIGDYLIGEDGQQVSILNHIPKGVPGLLATQFHQDDYNHIRVLTVVDPKLFDHDAELHLIRNTQERLGKSISVSVEKVDQMPRTPNGKVRQAICSLQPQ